MDADEEPTPGLYRHYKGGLYEVLFTGRGEGTGHKYVVYRSTDPDGQYWIRSTWEFCSTVMLVPPSTPGGGCEEVKRFVPVDRPKSIDREIVLNEKVEGIVASEDDVEACLRVLRLLQNAAASTANVKAYSVFSTAENELLRICQSINREVQRARTEQNPTVPPTPPDDQTSPQNG